jgi:hypothetical protein
VETRRHAAKGLGARIRGRVDLNQAFTYVSGKAGSSFLHCITILGALLLKLI